MPRCKICIQKCSLNHTLVKEYCKKKVSPCESFQAGAVFITGLEKPEGFSDWAWTDINPCVAVLLTGGNFSKGVFDGWTKDESTMIACCTDGIRPVIFKLERIEE